GRPLAPGRAEGHGELVPRDDGAALRPRRIGGEREDDLQEVFSRHARRFETERELLARAWRSRQAREVSALNLRPVTLEHPRPLHEREIAERVLVAHADRTALEVDRIDLDELVDLLHL